MISQLTSPIPGLSLVILREKIQDYDLIGCVKSAGKWGSDLLKKHPRLVKCLTETPNAKGTLNTRIICVPCAKSCVSQLSSWRSSAVFRQHRHVNSAHRTSRGRAAGVAAWLRCELSALRCGILIFVKVISLCPMLSYSRVQEKKKRSRARKHDPRPPQGQRPARPVDYRTKGILGSVY